MLPEQAMTNESFARVEQIQQFVCVDLFAGSEEDDFEVFGETLEEFL